MYIYINITNDYNNSNSCTISVSFLSEKTSFRFLPEDIYFRGEGLEVGLGSEIKGASERMAVFVFYFSLSLVDEEQKKTMRLFTRKTECIS